MSKTSGALAAAAAASGSAAPAVTVETTRSAGGRSTRSMRRTVTSRPSSRPSGDEGLGLRRRTGHHGHLATPSSAAATRVDRAVAPVPRTVTRGSGSARHPADAPRPGRRRRCCRPAGRLASKISVLPGPGPPGDRVDLAQAEHRLLQRHGQAEPAPAAVQAGHEVGQPVRGHLEPVVGPVQAERARTRPGAASGTASGRSGTRGPRSGCGSQLSHCPGWPGTRPGTPA